MSATLNRPANAPSVFDGTPLDRPALSVPVRVLGPAAYDPAILLVKLPSGLVIRARREWVTQ